MYFNQKYQIDALKAYIINLLTLTHILLRRHGRCKGKAYPLWFSTFLFKAATQNSAYIYCRIVWIIDFAERFWPVLISEQAYKWSYKYGTIFTGNQTGVLSILPVREFNFFSSADQNIYLCKQCKPWWDGSSESTLFAILFLILDQNPNLHQWTCPSSRTERSTSETRGKYSIKWAMYAQRRLKAAVHSRSLIKVFIVRMNKHCTLGYLKHASTDS